MIEPEDLERAQAEASRLGISVGVALIRLGLVSERELTELLARQHGVPAIDLTSRTVSHELATLVPIDVCSRLIVVPVERHGSVLVVAFADPSNVAAMAELEERTKLDLEVVVSCETAVRAAISRRHGSEP